ncbi:alternative NAD(P)H-ubiquinone oxidoreductase C1, chloroplastic/mitochondrial isoform X2 [Malania oleifera]|uniref:alternative NAD(P)H-ubiquinone oxidoreductase C1, chloroplastic/mitochondrial isoform X2 n=1 Tax=Malania oleifera TaxID=397392 RepID=UPI0025ADDEC7|nr:alternative NAD(P)H-ubiquinone oxidoreductase C1, chloroplastic/mitochondrial isoform X2 [Malania oleifera]
MAQSAFSVATTLALFNRGAKQWVKVFPVNTRKFGTNLSGFARIGRRGFRFVASNRAGMSGGTVISEGERMKRFFKWPEKQPRVCILGGGFGGLYTALRLESLEWPEGKRPQVLLIDQSERFVFKPLLYELLSGEVDTWEIAPRFSDLLENTSIQFFQDRVKFLHPCDHFGVSRPEYSSGGTIYLESGLQIEYDWLVLALGAEAKLDLIPGAAELAVPFSTLEDAYKVEKKLRALEHKYFGKDSLIRVAVVGCGYSGVELAATISERLQERGIVQAINVDTTICPTAPPGNREAALKVLQSRNVQLLLGYFVRCIRKEGASETSENATDAQAVQDIAAGHGPGRLLLELQPSERGLQSQILEADLVLWTVGSKPLLPEVEPCEKPNDLPLNARGQAETDETLRVKGHPRIFAVGDSSAFRDSNGRLLPATAQVAFQQADFAGWNLWAAINDRPLLPFKYQNLGEMMTLGRNDAAISPSFIEGLTLEGPLGHTARKIAYLIRLPTDEHRLKVGISWLTKSAVDSVASLHSTITKVLSGS